MYLSRDDALMHTMHKRNYCGLSILWILKYEVDSVIQASPMIDVRKLSRTPFPANSLTIRGTGEEMGNGSRGS